MQNPYVAAASRLMDSCNDLAVLKKFLFGSRQMVRVDANTERQVQLIRYLRLNLRPNCRMLMVKRMENGLAA